MQKLRFHSHSLPYFTDKEASFYDQCGNRIVVEKEKFKDVTTEGGRFVEFYTYEVKADGIIDNKTKIETPCNIEIIKGG
jgi:hypothetical protein